ncbi:transglycosylase domain-containing protein [Mangrovibrevibacter kandeliae]|uniref:transglycosylase domain-containing protein n=1 Tax=Mangrovibrevibacter kandeliae TaxID=2968473 RepID=UPI0021189CAD|nr:PBP1A family penicillin-binding protein [Aurantimonas sp. CSK15Z-1]MCQ8782240.1 PBP1A family penicillin-binding protein [Aurantimonas sp. CSK15Z-1]
MATRRGRERIEPTFGGERSGDDLRLSAEDRAVPDAGDVRKPTVKRQRRREERDAAPETVRSAAEARRQSRAGRPRRRRSLLGRLVYLAVLCALWGGIAVAGVAGYFAIKLPQEAWAIPERPPNVKIVAVDGQMLANRGVTGGEAVSLDEMSPYIPKAVVAIEDRRFYSHWGVDPLGILRAAFENVTAGQTVQGGSTLTQQLAKNIFLNPEQTLERKVQEAVLALWLESKFTKDQILEMYLNRVYFGSGATGVEAASRRYFNKSAKDVSLDEAALLAGLLKAPSRLSPARDPQAAKDRADVVLDAMRAEGMISEAEYTDAKAAKPTKAKSYWTGAENYAADLVMKDLKGLIGDVHQDVVVETTIDKGLEKEAESAIRTTIDEAKQNVSQGALVSIDGTGAIRAMVGGRDYAESQFNRAVDARRQPGSTFKPFVYETAMEFGWKPESVVVDGPVKIGNWTPENYDRRYRGPVMLADALAHSLNTVSAKLTDSVGSTAVIQTAHRLGIASDLADNVSIALGTSEVSLMELTGAFAPFANGGYLAKPHLINRVTTTDGKVLYERGAEVPPVVVDPTVLGEMNAMLERVVTSGTGRAAQLKGWQVAGKSGTTQDFKDAWFLGYTSNLTTGVWFGNDNGKPMKKVTGGGLPAQAWHSFMEAAHKGLPAMPLPGDYRIGQPQEPLTADVSNDYGDGELPPEDTYAPGDDRGGANVAHTVQPVDPQSGQPYSADPYDRGSRRDQRYADQPDDEDPYPGDPYSSDPYGNARYYSRSRDDRRLPEAAGRPRYVGREDLPPDAVLEGPVGGGRAVDRSIFHRLFGG